MANTCGCGSPSPRSNKPVEKAKKVKKAPAKKK
jgi:hypothetical protein